MTIGVIGTGYWGPNIVRNLLDLHQEITLYDIDKSNLRNTLDRFHVCDSVSTLDDILLNTNINSVVIAVPLKLHSKLVLKALKAGKHVFVEKSLCYSTFEADKIKASLNGKVLMVGHVSLFTQGIAKIKEFIKAKRIGRLTGISLTRTHLGKIYPGIDVATEVASHDIASLLFLIKELPVSVSAFGTSRLGHKKRDNSSIVLKYSSSLICSINVQWTSVLRERVMVVEGTSGTIVHKIDNGKEELVIYDQKTAFDSLMVGAKPQEAMHMVKVEKIDLEDREPLYDELNTFLSCIENNLTPLTDFEFGKKVVIILEATRRAIKSRGETIEIPW
jgi:predicted dehydrogenase